MNQANDIWRNFELDGVSSSGAHEPIKQEIREWGTWVEGIIAAFISTGGRIYQTRAALYADLAWPSGTLVWVMEDTNPAYNGIYRKTGASGSGAWVRAGDLPFSFVKAEVSGGTANAVQVTTTTPYNANALFVIRGLSPNTATPVTVSINGGSVLTVKTASGGNVPVNSLPPTVLGTIDGTNFRLASDVASAAVVAAAEAAADRAEAAAGTVVLKDFASRAFAQTQVIPVSAPFVRTLGYAAAGDGGDATYFPVGSVPAHAGYFVDAAGKIFALTSTRVKASQFGAFPDGNARVGLNNALKYLDVIGGGTLDIDKSGVYGISGGSVSLTDFTSHITINNTGGGRISAAAGLAVPVVLFRSGTTAPGSGKLTANGLRINNSLGSYVVGAQSCTGLDLQFIDKVVLNDFECIGGFNTLTGTGGGDSGISSVVCNSVIVNNPSIHQQPDAAFYPNWDNSGAIGGYFEVNGGHYTGNQAILTAKRNLKEVRFNGGLGEANISGLTTQWVNNGGWVHPARSLVIRGTKLVATLSNVVTVKGPNGRLDASNMQIVDIGYKRDGTGNVGANAVAFILHGCSKAKIRDCLFEMKDWVSVGDTAVLIRIDNDSGTPYTGGGHSIGGNIIRNWNRYASSAANDVGPASEYGPELFDGVATAVSTTFNPSSVLRYTDLSVPSRKITRFGGITFPATVTLTSIGSLAAGATTAVQTLSVPGMNGGETVTVQKITANLTAAAGVDISWRAVTDGVQYYFRNNGTAAFDFTNQSIQISI